MNPIPSPEPTKAEKVKLTKADRIDMAGDLIRSAFLSFVEARREMTIWEFQQFIRDDIKALGGAGFVGSIGQAIVEGATIEGRAALLASQGDAK